MKIRPLLRANGWGLVIGTMTLLLTAATPAHGYEALRPSLNEMSQKIAALLQGSGEDKIAVGAFTGPARISTSSGPGIKQVLIEELQKLKIKVDRRARLEVKGDYRDIMDEARNLLTLRLKATVLDGQGKVVVELEQLIHDVDVLAQVLGINKPDFGPGRSAKAKTDEMQKRLRDPALDIRDSRVRTERTSPYAIEIQVKKGSQYGPRSSRNAEGLAFVRMGKEEVFAVNLLNDSDFDAAVELTLDGLSMFVFGEVNGYRQVMVPRKSSLLVKGWFRTLKTSDEFVITDYAKGAVAELRANPESIGTITAVFSAAWDPKGKKPADEIKTRDPFAVGRKEQIETPYKEVVRKIGRVRDVVSVRYQKPRP